MFNDKIFNNTYGEYDLDQESIKFNIAPQYENTVDADEQTHYDILFQEIDDLIKKSEYTHYNEVTKNGILKKLNKVQINKVYVYVLENIGGNYNRVDIFGVLSDYFDVLPNKFYNSLSNKFKDELITELDVKYNILKKKGINKLF